MSRRAIDVFSETGFYSPWESACPAVTAEFKMHVSGCDVATSGTMLTAGVAERTTDQVSRPVTRGLSTMVEETECLEVLITVRGNLTDAEIRGAAAQAASVVERELRKRRRRKTSQLLRARG